MVLMTLLAGGCSSMLSMSYGTNDLYRTNNREEVAKELTAIAEAEKARAEARKAQYEALMAEAEYEAMANNSGGFGSVLASDYESAYARRLYGFSSPTYRLPASYYNLATNDAMFYATAYDPAFYNVMVSGDQVWVEPKYVTSMFGSWGATNITFGIYASPWNYGWGVYANPFYYSWYDWNWNMCYNPYHYDWYWGMHYPGFPHHPHYPQRPPHHRPDYHPGHGQPGHGKPDTGVGSRHPQKPNYNGDAGRTSSRYTSPTSNRNYGAVESRGDNSRGAVSTGVNNRRTNGVTSGSSSSRGTRNESYNSRGAQNNSNFRSSSSSSSRSNSGSNYNSSSYRPRSSSGASNNSSNSSGGNHRSGGSSSSSRSGGTTSSRR